jgi:hypothetical protein
MEALILFSSLGVISTIALVAILWYQHKHNVLR